MSAATQTTDLALVRQWCKVLHLPTVAAQAEPLATAAVREQQTHLRYVEALLAAEVEERERNVVGRRLKEARFPAVKTWEEFDSAAAPHLPLVRLRQLLTGDYLARAEPVIFLGDTGTGKTHLATSLGVAACRQKKRVRFTTVAELVTELTEAKSRSELGRVAARWMRYELLIFDEMAYVAIPESAAELLFQIVAGRAERAAVIVTTNLPFSEWTSMFPNARLCKAMLDRLTDRAHIIETGSESYRFRRSVAKRKEKPGGTERPAEV